MNEPTTATRGMSYSDLVRELMITRLERDHARKELRRIKANAYRAEQRREAHGQEQA